MRYLIFIIILLSSCNQRQDQTYNIVANYIDSDYLSVFLVDGRGDTILKEEGLKYGDAILRKRLNEFQVADLCGRLEILRIESQGSDFLTRSMNFIQKAENLKVEDSQLLISYAKQLFEEDMIASNEKGWQESLDDFKEFVLRESTRINDVASLKCYNEYYSTIFTKLENSDSYFLVNHSMINPKIYKKVFYELIINFNNSAGNKIVIREINFPHLSLIVGSK